MAARALRCGGIRKGATLIEWDISGKCTSPYYTSYYGRPSAEWGDNHLLRGTPRKLYDTWDPVHGAGVGIHPQVIDRYVTITKHGPIPMEVVIFTPCHKCEKCLKHRAALWTARAIQESKDSVRTWFSTMTLRPDVAHLALMHARAKEAQQGVDFDTLRPPEQFRLWVAQISPEITKFLKRVRENSQCYGALRYLLVVEAHKSGVPHFHALFHELDPDKPVRHKVLSKAWNLGFSNHKLVPDKLTIEEDGRIIRPAQYVCSYLNKSSSARVRASERYGQSRLTSLHLDEKWKEYLDPEETRVSF